MQFKKDEVKSIDELKEDLEGIESVPNTLVTQVNSLSSSISAINTKLAEYASTKAEVIRVQALEQQVSIEAQRLTDAETGIGNLDEDLAELSAQVEDIQLPDLSGIQNSLFALQDQVDEIEQNVANLDIPENLDLTDVFDVLEIFELQLSALTDDLYELNAYCLFLENRIVNLESQLSGKYYVEITRFTPGSSYIEFTTRSAGDYVVVLTLYGTDLDNFVPYLPPSQNVEVVYDSLFGVGSTMRTIIVQPKTAGTPPVSSNWTLNKIVEVDFTGSGYSVDYATAEIGSR
jgi:hypothetical protein